MLAQRRGAAAPSAERGGTRALEALGGYGSPSGVLTVLPETNLVAAALIEAADRPSHHLRRHLRIVALVQDVEQRRASEGIRTDVEGERDERIELVLVQAHAHVGPARAFGNADTASQHV